jgi:CheY-like chemotaxis protein
MLVPGLMLDRLIPIAGQASREGEALASQWSFWAVTRLEMPLLLMSVMDGLELLGEVKQRRPELPVMMVTAYGDDERQRRARELGDFEFITKPVNFEQLKEQLRQLSAPTN